MAVGADVCLSFQITPSAVVAALCCCQSAFCPCTAKTGQKHNWSYLHRVPLCYVMVFCLGTNLWDAQQTVDSILEDFPPAHVPLPLMQEDDLSVVLRKGGVPFIDLQGYTKIDKHEIDQGQKVGKPREKLVSTEEMLQIAASC